MIVERYELDGYDLGDLLAHASTPREREQAREFVLGLIDAAPIAEAEVATTTAAVRTLIKLDVGRMMTSPPPPVEYAVEPLLIPGMLTLLVGKEGVGKSLFGLGLGVSLCTDEPIAGFRPKLGNVVYVDAENGEREIHRRIHTLGLTPETAHLLSAYSVRGFDLRHNLDELEEILVNERPTLLILDSFRSLWDGEENNSQEVSAVLDPLRNLVRDYDTATLLLHHTPRGRQDYRGSSGIGASAELIFVLASHDDDPETERRYLDCRKCRPAPEPDRRWLRLTAEMGMVLIDEAEPYLAEEDGHEHPAPKREELTALVTSALAASTPEKPTRRADIARKTGRDPKNGSVGRVLKALTESGEIQRTDTGYYPTLNEPGAKVPEPPRDGTRGTPASPSSSEQLGLTA